MVLLDFVLQQGEGNNGSGQEAVPVPSDGMRAPPATEAVDVRWVLARLESLTHISSNKSKSKIPDEVVVEVTGAHEPVVDPIPDCKT